MSEIVTRIIATSPKIRIRGENPISIELREHRFAGRVNSYTVTKVIYSLQAPDKVLKYYKGSYHAVPGATKQLQFHYAFARWNALVEELDYEVRKDYSIVEIV